MRMSAPPDASAEPGMAASSSAQNAIDRAHGAHPVTRSGTGFVLSRAVYHGISRKKRK